MMNMDQVFGNWREFKGRVKQQWAKLTDDDLEAIEGKRDELYGRLQSRYGTTRDETEKMVRDFESQLQ